MRDLAILTGARPSAPTFLIQRTDDPSQLADYRGLRHDAFVRMQGLFAGSDRDDIDDDLRTVVLVAVTPDGAVLGGVRLAPCTSRDIGWWAGSRLVVRTDGSGAGTAGVGAALVRAACAHAERAGALRFDATVQTRYEPLFLRLGWVRVGERTLRGQPHLDMRWPVDRIERLAGSTKSMLASVLAPLRANPHGLGAATGFVGDDGVPVPGSDIIAACDAIVPSMVERDPEWAGWCAVLVNLNDLSAMGATPVGMLDAVGAPTASLLTRVVRGLARAAGVWEVPVLGGHTQSGVPASLSVTALGRTTRPVPAGGGSVGDRVRLTVDVEGQWRPGYAGAQWDSSSTRSTADLQMMGSFVGRAQPKAAKDVSMAGLVGTTGMLAEASGTGAVIDVASVPTPDCASTGDWLTCFPGFAMITADAAGAAIPPAGPAVSAECGTLTAEPGVQLRWPDGELTVAVRTSVTGLGPASGKAQPCRR